MPYAALVGSFWIKCSKSHCLAIPRKWHLKVWSGEIKWSTTDKAQQKSSFIFHKWAGGEIRADLQTQTKEDPTEQTKNTWAKDVIAPSASIWDGNARDGSKSIFWAATGQLLIPQGMQLPETRHSRKNYSFLLLRNLCFNFWLLSSKAYVASIQIAHLTKHTGSPKIRNNLLEQLK